MAGYQTVQQIEVRIWGQLVGAVALDPAIGYHVFEYARLWRQTTTCSPACPTG